MPGPQVPTKQAPAAAPMAPRQLISKIIQSAKTIEKPRAAAMPPSEPQSTLPTPVPPSPPRIPSVPNHILSSRKMTGPTTPQGLVIIIKPVSRSQFQSPLAQCKFLTSHRTPPRRQPHCAGPTE